MDGGGELFCFHVMGSGDVVGMIRLGDTHFCGSCATFEIHARAPAANRGAPALTFYF